MSDETKAFLHVFEAETVLGVRIATHQNLGDPTPLTNGHTMQLSTDKRIRVSSLSDADCVLETVVQERRETVTKIHVIGVNRDTEYEYCMDREEKTVSLLFGDDDSGTFLNAALATLFCTTYGYTFVNPGLGTI